VKEKLIYIPFTFLSDNEKKKYDMVPSRTDCSSCDVCLLGQLVNSFLQAFNQPASGSKANDKVVAQSQIH